MTTAIETQYQTIAEFNIKYLQFIDDNHQETQPLPEFASDETLLHLYQQMSLTRALDNKAVNLQRQGKMGTYPAAKGQEAVGIGIGHAMYNDDIFCTYYRDQAVMLERGIDPSDILLYWGGDERGSNFSNPDRQHDLPVCVPIAGQCLHATGIAYALKYRNQARAVVTTIGEGGTSKGDFYEAMNLAGAWQLPVVFVVNNNQWAISVARQKQTACGSIAQKAIAAGINGIQVDGNDVVAVRHAVHEALNKARNNGGPTLIEAITYRLCDHTTADDASRYIPKDDMQAAWQKEPIARLGYYLEQRGLWSKDKEAQLQKQLQQQVEASVANYLNVEKPKATDMFDHLYAQLPDAYLDQYDEIAASQE